MDEKIIRFFKRIEFDEDNYKYFEKANIKRVDVIKSENRWNIYFEIDETLDINIFEKLYEKSKVIQNVSKIHFYFDVKKPRYLKEYFIYYFNILINACPTISSIIDNEITYQEKSIIIEVLNEAEDKKINGFKRKIEEFLFNMGFGKIEVTTNYNDEKRLEFMKNMQNTQANIVKEEKKVIYGTYFEGEAVKIKSIIAEERQVILETFIFGIENKKTSTGLNIISIKISDYSDSISAKMFIKSDGEAKYILDNVVTGQWYKFKGDIRYDNFEKDLSYNIRDILPVMKRSNKRTDTAQRKRVELHIHTVMSQMDGLIHPKKLVKKINDFGHIGFGITDKNCVQSFPKFYHDAGDLKVMYGSELFVVDDEVKITTKDTDDLLKGEVVVFDLETTGLNAGGSDTIIEIGAVKIKNGEIIDRFDELINPHVKLREVIKEITNITDEMLEDKEDEKTVFKRFIDWIKDLPLVAHNATFDTSFLESAFRKYDMGTLTNPVIDTMELSKILSPDEKKHNLTALTKRWNIKWEEDKHHRADYDAEATGLIYHKMISSLDGKYSKVKDLNKLINKENIYKNYKPFHMTVYAKNNVGLKNLFKIISYANTKYFFKTPRILKSELVKYREGLIFGSGCINGEVFETAKTKGEEDLVNVMKFYDFIEVNPPSLQQHLIESSMFSSIYDVKENINKIINAAKTIGKLVCATGDVHTLDPEDNIYREILVNQKLPGGGLHPLCRSDIKTIPNAYLMNTEEMLQEFDFLDEKTREEIVIDNPIKILDMKEEVTILKKDLYAPKMENSVQTIKQIVYDTAKSRYGEVLPEIIETRLDKELTGIINGGYDVIYLIAQKLVKKSNDDGYIVGSRGSVGSSLVATFLNITEVNPLPPHYVCPKCKKSYFTDDDGKELSYTYGSGFDMPDKICECGEKLNKNGQDIPFETFLGFNADKTPDIDLNFSGEYQANAHNYTKVLFGEDFVFRAGTVSTVAEKTAYGYVKGYMENKGVVLRRVEIERLAQNITGIKRTSGQHPGGIIVIPNYQDVFDFTPYQYPAENTDASWYTTHFDFHDIEPNVLKLDILGHDDPTVLKYLSDLCKMKIEDVPLDDQKVMSLFSSFDVLDVIGDIKTSVGTLGVPEFGTSFVMKLLEETRPKTFAELIKISGLSHGTGVWAGNARDIFLKKICEFKEIIGCRDDIMLTLIKNNIEKGQAFKISEFIRKGKVKKEPDTWVGFKQILQEHNLPSWYIDSCEKIEYMFPKAHATAYVTNGFRVAWFKVYYPLEYYSVYLSIRESMFDVEAMVSGRKAILDKLQDIEDKGFEASNKESGIYSSLLIANELYARGFVIDNISLSESEATHFKVNKDRTGLIPPFTCIDGLGVSAATKIVEERNNKPYVSVDDLQSRGKVGVTLMDKFRGLNIVKDLPESAQLSIFDL